MDMIDFGSVRKKHKSENIAHDRFMPSQVSTRNHLAFSNASKRPNDDTFATPCRGLSDGLPNLFGTETTNFSTVVFPSLESGSRKRRRRTNRTRSRLADASQPRRSGIIMRGESGADTHVNYMSDASDTDCSDTNSETMSANRLKHASLLENIYQPTNRVLQYSTPQRKICSSRFNLRPTLLDMLKPSGTGHDPASSDQDCSSKREYWSKNNLLAIGLQDGLWAHHVESKNVFRLLAYERGTGRPHTHQVTSVGFNSSGARIAVGSSIGVVSILDVETKVPILEFRNLLGRIPSISWLDNHVYAIGEGRVSNQHPMPFGSQFNIFLHDTRLRSSGKGRRPVIEWEGHYGEVCGMKWSPSCDRLATGSNDNSVRVWDLRSTQPLLRYTHNAAVKALAWSPHKPHLLCSGGGSDDRSIRIMDTTRGLQKKLKRLHSCYGHTARVLYTAMSPDGSSVCTAAGGVDNTIRFWKLFPTNSGNDGGGNKNVSMGNLNLGTVR